MARDSLFGERIVWKGRPKVVTVPMAYRLGAYVHGLVAVVSTSFAIVVSNALHAPVGGLLVFAAWCATLGLALGYGPVVWRSEAEYAITDRKVMWKRGRFHRMIERSAISYARIHWHPSLPGVGDLELVRAVPTGALKRRLSLVLHGVVGPDRLWAIVRGIPASGGAGDGHRPLAQRLDDGERVLWAARPIEGWRDWVPAGSREVVTAGIAILVALAFVAEVSSAVPATRHVLAGGLPVRSTAFAALMVAITLTALLLAATAAALGYLGVVRPGLLARATRYLVTDRRVLIQRGSEELHLDRSRIIDVIDAPAHGGAHDVFLVLDGPRARAVAASGAFGERDVAEGLVPVFHRVSNAEEVTEILRTPSPPPSVDDAA